MQGRIQRRDDTENRDAAEAKAAARPPKPPAPPPPEPLPPAVSRTRHHFPRRLRTLAERPHHLEAGCAPTTSAAGPRRAGATQSGQHTRGVVSLSLRTSHGRGV